MAVSIRKPKMKNDINAEDALSFAEPKKSVQEINSKSGLVPDGNVRLTANIRFDLHLKLKMRAAQDRTTMGKLIEGLIEQHL
jgi:hypothetical protein